MTVLKATVEHSSRAGTIKAYRGMQSTLNKSGFGHCLPSDAAIAAAKNGLERLADADLKIHATVTQDGYRMMIMQTITMSGRGSVTLSRCGPWACSRGGTLAGLI